MFDGLNLVGLNNKEGNQNAMMNNNVQGALAYDRRCNMINYQGVMNVGVVQAMKNLLNHIQVMKSDAISENEFLKRELSDNVGMLNSFMEESGKVNKMYDDVNSQLQSTRNAIIESRRQINIEKDKIARYEVELRLANEELQKQS